MFTSALCGLNCWQDSYLEMKASAYAHVPMNYTGTYHEILHYTYFVVNKTNWVCCYRKITSDGCAIWPDMKEMPTKVDYFSIMVHPVVFFSFLNQQ